MSDYTSEQVIFALNPHSVFAEETYRIPPEQVVGSTTVVESAGGLIFRRGRTLCDPHRGSVQHLDRSMSGVIRGHAKQHEKASALPLKADMARCGYRCPRCATSGHSLIEASAASPGAVT